MSSFQFSIWLFWNLLITIITNLIPEKYSYLRIYSCKWNMFHKYGNSHTIHIFALVGLNFYPEMFIYYKSEFIYHRCTFCVWFKTTYSTTYSLKRFFIYSFCMFNYSIFFLCKEMSSSAVVFLTGMPDWYNVLLACLTDIMYYWHAWLI